jgi:cell wall-associated NlpC family hydrolase
MPTKPPDLDRVRVNELLCGIRAVSDIGSRVEWISRQWLGLPYVICPLGGGADLPETLRASVDGFDCVTYVESVLALASSDSVGQFADHLRRIRYREGVVGWATRNHYMTAWIRANEKAGFVTNRTRGRGLVRRERNLNVVPGLPERSVRVASIRKSDFIDRSAQIRTGDLAFFASTRPNLDVFHCGVLIRAGDGVRMRHAARSHGSVAEEPLTSFLNRNRMVGVILVRPEEAFSRAA